MKHFNAAKLSAAGLFASLFAIALPASAALDVTSVTGALSGDGVTAVTAIGLGVLAVLAIVVVFKLVRRAM